MKEGIQLEGRVGTLSFSNDVRRGSAPSLMFMVSNEVRWPPSVSRSLLRICLVGLGVLSASFQPLTGI